VNSVGVTGVGVTRVGPRVYLAGPDVFLAEPRAWAERKKSVCARFGLTGVSPFDILAHEPAEWAALPEWRRIAARNEAHIRGCAGVIANLTPFRGPSADVGTVYEVGFARALGLPIFAYATTEVSFTDRTIFGSDFTQAADGQWFDCHGLVVEQFGLFDNLMIEGGIAGSGGGLVLQTCGDTWRDLTPFERCVALAAGRLAGQRTGRPDL
jgi:nucleoside 2-deoxyribosyltransferase